MSGLLLHIALRDRWTALAPVFYALPKPCLGGLALVLAAWPQARRLSRLLAVLVAVSVGAWWHQTSWGLGPATSATTRLSGNGAELRVLFWNLSRPSKVHAGLIARVRQTQPDLVACVEPGPQAGELLSAYRAALPDYQVEWMPRGILWLSKPTSRYRERGKLDGIGAFARFEVTQHGRTFPVVVADVYVEWTRARTGQLNEALAQTQGRSDALLLGDFNTPWESLGLDPYRSRLQHAWRTAGTGPQETWPLGLPLLSLDHAWIGSDWEILDVRKHWEVAQSDHAALEVHLRRRN